MANIKTGRASARIHSDATESIESEALFEAKSASVPVVVIGASIGGLAAAVAIRSRTGRAVCVLDVKREEVTSREQEEEMSYILSARCLDAVRAINADLYRTVLMSVEDDACAGGASKSSSVYLNSRLTSSHLRDILSSHLTGGHGGSSFLWRSSPIRSISFTSRTDEDEGREEGRPVLVTLKDGVVIKAELVVVATDTVPFQELLREPSSQEGKDSLPEGLTPPEVWASKSSRRPSDLEVALLNEGERRVLSFMASLSPSTPVTTHASETEPATMLAGQHPGMIDEAHSSSSVDSMAAVLAGLKISSSLRSCKIPKGADAPWSFREGHVVLIGAAAHPWASSRFDGLELDLADAAQLGCSLFDWKFQVRMASDRFQAIRKRRLAAVLTSPRMTRGWSIESPEAIGDTSTAASPTVLMDDDQTFVPTRDAYAELLPAGGLAYEVQEAEVF